MYVSVKWHLRDVAQARRIQERLERLHWLSCADPSGEHAQVRDLQVVQDWVP